MKKNFIYAMLSAIALSGGVMFSGCSSSDDVIDNPDYNPEENTVKTTLTLNIDPNGSGKSDTRQTSEVTQEAGNFRGMQDMYLFSSTGDAVISNSTVLTDKIVLDNLTSSDISTSKSNKTYTGKEIKVNTTHFLFYGKATLLSPANNLANGKTESNLASLDPTSTETSARAISFTSSSILGSTIPDGWAAARNKFVAYLNGVGNTTGWSTSTNPTLSQLYTNFTSTGIVRGGSANAILATVQKLYDQLRTIYTAAIETAEEDETLGRTLTEEEALAKTIINKIMKYDGETLSVKREGEVLSWDSGMSAYKDFPTDLYLPEGSAIYVVSDDGTAKSFQYQESRVPGLSNTTYITNYIYPSELFYLTNTPLKAKSTVYNFADFSTTTWKSGEWNTAGDWGNSVSALTKTIALTNNIQYGTALMSTQVKCTPATVGETDKVLYDNSAALDGTTTTNKAISYTDESFKLTGIIIGGQPASVGFDFLPKGDIDKYLYDRVSTDVYAKESPNQTNYTLVYDNFKSGETQSDVAVCLEFQNLSGQEFYGVNGLILPNQKFYLVGNLIINTLPNYDTSNTPSFTDTYVYYPSTTPRVFIQDYKTTVVFNMTGGAATGARGSLANAFITIPDLNTTTQSLGLSVSLSWEAGYTFNSDL